MFDWQRPVSRVGFLASLAAAVGYLDAFLSPTRRRRRLTYGDGLYGNGNYGGLK